MNGFDDFTAAVCVEEVYPADQDPSLYPWDEPTPVKARKRRFTIGQRLRATFWLAFGIAAPFIVTPLAYLLMTCDPRSNTADAIGLTIISVFVCTVSPFIVYQTARDIKAGNWWY